MNNANAATVPVTIISLMSRREDTEKAPRYDVQVPLGETDEETLENAFALTNRDDRPLATKVCSTSGGDIMILNGNAYSVAFIGFLPVTLESIANL